MKKSLFLLAMIFLHTNVYSASGGTASEKNWLQRTGTFCAKNPIDVALGAFTLAAGSCALASPSTAIETLDKLPVPGQIFSTSAFAGGCYSLGLITSAMLGKKHRLSSISEIVKKDLSSLRHASRFALYNNAYSASGGTASEKNWLQRTETFFYKNPIDVFLGALTLVAGSHALASPSTAIEKLKKLPFDRQIFNTSVFAGGCYSLGLITSAMLGKEHRLPSISETVKKDLFGSQQDTHPTYETPSALSSLGHAYRFALYETFLERVLSELTYANSHKQNASASNQVNLEIPPMYAILIGPLIEEIMFTYVPHMINKKYAQFVTPFIFGSLHTQYNYIGMLNCACTNFLNHRSLIARSKHTATPFLNHAINNALVYYNTRMKS